MSDHTRHHSRDTGHGLEKDEADEPLSLTHYIRFGRIMPVAGGYVGAPAKESNRVERKPIRGGAHFPMRNLDVFELFLRDVGMGP